MSFSCYIFQILSLGMSSFVGFFQLLISAIILLLMIVFTCFAAKSCFRSRNSKSWIQLYAHCTELAYELGKFGFVLNFTIALYNGALVVYYYTVGQGDIHSQSIPDVVAYLLVQTFIGTSLLLLGYTQYIILPQRQLSVGLLIFACKRGP